MEQASLPHRLVAVLEENVVAALVADPNGRVVFWSRGAAALLGREKAATLGRPCWETVRGRDVFGNTFCSPQCPVLAMAARGEPVPPFSLVAETRGPGREEELAVTTMRLEGSAGRPYVLHLLQPSFPARRPVGAAAARRSEEPRPTEGLPAAVLTRREEQVLDLIRLGPAEQGNRQEAGHPPRHREKPRPQPPSEAGGPFQAGGGGSDLAATPREARRPKPGRWKERDQGGILAHPFPRIVPRKERLLKLDPLMPMSF